MTESNTQTPVFKLGIEYNRNEDPRLPRIPKAKVDFNNIMQTSQTAIMSRLNCHNIGRIVSFNAEHQTVDVELMILKQFKNRTIIPPLLTEVPLIMLGAGGGHITMPDPTGTICILLFMDRNIDRFLETGEQYLPATPRMHDFTDCVALTTFKTLVNPLTDYDEKAVTIINEEIIEEIKNQSYIKVYGDSVQIKTMQGEDTSAAINVTDKINIENTSQNFANLIQSFLTICKNLSVDTNTGLVTAQTQKQLEDLQKKFNQLLN